MDKAMTKKKYLSKFSRSARWRLGSGEAAEAIADYRELVFQEEREESKLVEELGDPVQAAWLLTDAREYKRWRRVFVILVCCALFCADWAYDGLPFYWRLIHWQSLEWWVEFVQILVPLAVGMPLSILWFRRKGGKSGPVAKALVLALALVALARCYDRRWAALLVLGLTVSVLSLIAQTVLLGANPQSSAAEMAAVRGMLFGWLVPVGIAGLVGTGVLLR